MRWEERVHEGLKVRSPPLCEGVAYLPFVVHALARELVAYWCQTFVQTELEAFDLIVFGLEIVARSGKRQPSGKRRSRKGSNLQFEESIRYLQHQDVRMVVFMAYEYTLARSPHAMLFVMLF